MLKRDKPSTVGRGKRFTAGHRTNSKNFKTDLVHLSLGNSENFYDSWETPTCIVSDGGYGILGFDGDTSSPHDLINWYEPHIKAWSALSTPQTTLWFWNTEIGWATLHPTLEKYGWTYINCNVWDKGRAHIAGNINTQKIRRFPVVTEVCAQYVRKAQIGSLDLKVWLKREWMRTRLPLKKANEACGVKDAAVRKYLDQGHLWYFPPPNVFEKLVNYANKYGDPSGIPYFSIDGLKAASAFEWQKMRAKFTCPHGFTNVWARSPLKGKERIRVRGKTGHLNQKPLDLMDLIVTATTEEGDVVWEPFGGMFSASLAASNKNRKAFGAEIEEDYFVLGVERFNKLL